MNNCPGTSREDKRSTIEVEGRDQLRETRENWSVNEYEMQLSGTSLLVFQNLMCEIFTSPPASRCALRSKYIEER